MEKLNEKIDGLTAAVTVPQLAKQVQAILRQMSYYIAQSEGSMLDLNEEMHGAWTEALYQGAGKSAEAEAAKPRRAEKKGPSKGERQFGAVKATAARRQPTANVPASLLALLNDERVPRKAPTDGSHKFIDDSDSGDEF